MNLQDQDCIEAFRTRLEIRFRRDRIFRRCKVLMGVVLASTLSVALPYGLRAVDSPPPTPIEGPGKWYMSLPQGDLFQ